MGITTANLGLYKPTVGEVSWGTLRNANEDVVDLSLGTQHELDGTHRFITVTGATGFIQLPTLNTTERDALTPINGMMIYNSSTVSIQSFEGGAWSNIALGSSQFTDNAFRINDDGDITKQIAFQAAGITTGTLRTITMPDADIDLGDVAANTAHVAGDGSDHADVATNTTHSSGSGSDHADVASNTTHRSSDGTDHANVVLNDTHRGTTHDYAFITGNDGATDVTAAELEELSDGSVTSLHSHAGIGTDEFVQVDAAAAPDYIGAAANDGVLRTVAPLGYTDGGDFITIGIDINALGAATVASGDLVLIEDIDDSNNPKKVTAQDIADLGGGGGATLELDVTQANAFSVDEWVYHDGSTYELADASAAATAESIGIITAATGADFTVQFGGRITGLTGLTAGEAHFLSETPGAITATAPVTIGAVVKPVLIADSTTTGFIFNMRGISVDTVSVEVTATSVIADNAVIRGDGGSRGVQDSTMTISDNGEMNNPSQPAFLVENAGTQADMATGGVTVIYDSEVYDIGSNFASNTFTAPVTGKYHLSVLINLTNIDSVTSDTRITLVTSNRTYSENKDPRQFAGDIVGRLGYSISITADMDAGDTASVSYFQIGGIAQTDIQNNTDARFSGHLVA